MIACVKGKSFLVMKANKDIADLCYTDGIHFVDPPPPWSGYHSTTGWYLDKTGTLMKPVPIKNADNRLGI